MKQAYLIATMLLMLLLVQTAHGDATITGTASNRYLSANIDSDNDGQLNYIMETNLWNITSGTGQVVMTWTNASGLSVDINFSGITQEDPSGWVHAYPEIWYGAKAWNTLGPANDGPISLPAKLGSMNDFQTTVSYNVSRTDQHYNFPLETWLMRSTNRGSVGSNEVEFMIWMDFVGMQGAGSVVGSLTAGGRSYNIWRDGDVGNGHWEYFSFVPTSPSRSGTVTLTWGPFIRAAQALSDRADWPNLYFTGVELGTEFGTPDYLQTSLAWTCSKLTFATTSNPMLGGTTTTTAGSTTTTTSTTTTSGTTTSTTSVSTTTSTTSVSTSTTTTSGGTGCTCTSGCNGTSISPNFTQDGSGTYCWQATSGTYINSWNLNTLNVNGTDYTNKYAFTSSLPAKINSVWYIYYSGSYAWSHFELKN